MTDHFFFSKGSEESGKDKKKSSPGRWYKENTDQKSFKDDPVLNALKEDRLPDVRPNYEYFGQLLGMNQTVQVSPSMCWLYLSNDLIRDQSSTETRFYTDEDGMKREEEVIKVKTYHPEQGLLPHWDFPHRYEFTSGRKEWGARDKEDRSIRQTFLHEYNWDMKQTESSSVREVCDEWEVDHPELHASLQSVIDHHDLQNAHAHSAAAAAAAVGGGPAIGAGSSNSSHGQCDIIHMDLTLDVHGITKLTKLPKGSAFRPLVKITVAQQNLQSHHWCVRTRLERPPELCSNGRGTTFKDDLEMGYVFTHVRGCHDRNPTCDCRERRRGNVWSVPFPEVQWAEALDLCATYPRYFLPKEKKSSGPGGINNSNNRKGGIDDDDDPKEEDVVTQMDLMKATAMFQELWSSPPAPPGAPEQLNWTRRAVILWTFNTIHFFDKEKKLCTTPAGTNWRFLTAVDPLSPMHQERMLLSGGAAAAQRGDRVVMSPSPTYQQMLNAQMAENFSSAAWPGGNVHLGMPQGGTQSNPSSMPVSPMPTYGPSNLSLHGNFTNGLVTPPPSAALTSSYVAAFDASSGIGVHAQDLGAQGLGFMPTTTSNNTEASFMTSGSFGAESYIPYNTGNNSFYEEPEDDESDTTLPGCDSADLSGLASQQWSGMNGAAHAGNSALAALDWNHPDLAGGLSMTVTDDTGLGGGEAGANPLDDSTRQMANPYDACVRSDVPAAGRQQNRAQSGEHYLASLQQRMQGGLDGRERLEQQQQQHRTSANEDDIWNTSASTPNNCDGGSMVGGGSQDASAQFGQSAAAEWDDSAFGHQFHQQQQQSQQQQSQQQQHRLHNDGLPRTGQEYLGGSGGLSPLVSRKRSREGADGDDAYSSLGSMAGYVTTAPSGHKNLRYRLS